MVRFKILGSQRGPLKPNEILDAARKIAFAAILMAAITTVHAQSFDRDFGQDTTQCTSPNGTEIKQTYVMSAPSGYFFQDVEIAPIGNVVSYGGGNIGCSEFNYGNPTRQYTRTQALVGGKNISIEIPKEVTVFAHADCTSNAMHIIKGDSIRVMCHFHGLLAPIQ